MGGWRFDWKNYFVNIKYYLKFIIYFVCDGRKIGEARHSGGEIFRWCGGVSEGH